MIYQQNTMSPFEDAVAWKVIKNCGIGDVRTFNFSSELSITCSDSYGNYTTAKPAQNGTSFMYIETPTGKDLMTSSQPSTSPNTIEFQNNLVDKKTNVRIYRDGKLLAMKENVEPGQKAVFQFNPAVFIGVLPHSSSIEEGKIMSQEILSEINNKIALFGITSADLVMYGGNGTPFSFQLENVKY